MSKQEKTKEINRLISSFEAEAAKFHDLAFTIEYVTPQSTAPSRQISKKHHAINLWQFYGTFEQLTGMQEIISKVDKLSLDFGLPGAQLTCLGIIEGEKFDVFKRMATRAGSLFDQKELEEFNTKIIAEIVHAEHKKNPDAKLIATSNNNPLAVWLNYLLYFLSQTHPGRERAKKIEPDPFSLSLFALERLKSEGSIGKIEPVVKRVKDIKFQVALSFAGEQRSYVEQVARHLQLHLGEHSVFYDFDFRAELAQPNADILLQNIYRNQTRLNVVFLCENYAEKSWCGLEWRAIRELIKLDQADQIRFVRFDNSIVPGVFEIDGYLDAKELPPQEIAELIYEAISKMG